jgi:hypothetical protein
MKLTKFDKLKLAIEALGASPVVSDLVKKLKGDGVDIDASSTVVTDNGIYYIDKTGLLTKVVIHIVDKPLDGHWANNLYKFVSNGQFESSELIDEIHKFHVLNCMTIKRAESEGWVDRYKGSKRTDGRFFYRFLKDNRVLSEQLDQELNICKNCLKLVSQHVGGEISVEKFDLDEFFSVHGVMAPLDIPVVDEMACAPNIYQDDWPDISTAFKKIRNYKCEGEHCPHPNLSESSLKRYLHTHHVSMDKTNNQISNLKALCIYCHANQPNHSQLKASKDYKDYIGIIGLGVLDNRSDGRGKVSRSADVF